MKRIITTLAILACAQALFAQGGFTLAYPISFPMGDLHDYINKTSFRGIVMEFDKRVKSHVDVGLETGWFVFYQRQDAKTYVQENTSISGIQYRYTNSVPILLGAKWYKETGKMTVPYVGLGLGTLYSERATDFGLYRITQTAWQFCVRPELGLRLKMQSGVSGLIGLKYYSGFSGGDLDGQSFLSINVGFVFSSSDF